MNNEKERHEETGAVSELNRNTKINLHKKPKEDLTRGLNTKVNGTAHSKSMVKGAAKNTQKQQR